MISSQHRGTRARPTRSSVLTVLVLVATTAVGVVTVSSLDVPRDHPTAPVGPGAVRPSAPLAMGVSTVPTSHPGRGRATQPATVADDGAVGAGVSVFDDGSAAVANLDPSLLRAVRRAATDAGHDGVEFVVNSGWRSAAYQEQLLEEAIAEYGSKEEAERWVATPQTSAHVSGDAVDLGPSSATRWLSRHGAAYGLCQIYRNEPWHYELRPGAVDHGCPAMYADPTHDPRMQR